MKVYWPLLTCAVGLTFVSCKPRNFNQVNNFSAKKGFIWKKSAYLRFVPLVDKSTSSESQANLNETSNTADSSTDKAKQAGPKFCAYYTEDAKSDLSKSTQYTAEPLDLADFANRLKSDNSTSGVYSKWVLSTKEVEEKIVNQVPKNEKAAIRGAVLTAFSAMLASCVQLNGGVKNCIIQINMTTLKFTGKLTNSAKNKAAANGVTGGYSLKQVLGAYMTTVGAGVLAAQLGYVMDNELLKKQENLKDKAYTMDPDEFAKGLTSDLDTIAKSNAAKLTWDELQQAGNLLNLTTVPLKGTEVVAKAKGSCAAPKDLDAETVKLFRN
jgi:hypothetical protein